MTDKTGVTWLVDTLPCPECKQFKVIGYLLVTETGEHQHTKYVCTFWPSSPDPLNVRTEPCGWSGWVVPGWDSVGSYE